MISIVIPTRNRSEDLIKCLACIASQSRPDLISEVIIVNDYSTEFDSERLIAEARRLGVPAVLIANSHMKGAAGARNCGASIASGEILAFLDDDSFPVESWAEVLVSTLAANSDCALTGRILPAQPNGVFSRARQLRYDLRRRSALRDPRRVQFLAGGNSAIRRELFCKVGGFEPRYVMMHDRELVFRLPSVGCGCLYVDELVIRHRHYKGFATLVQGSFRSATYRRLLEREYGLPGFRISWQIASWRQLLACGIAEWRSQLVPAVVSCGCELFHVFGYAWCAFIGEPSVGPAERGSFLDMPSPLRYHEEQSSLSTHH